MTGTLAERMAGVHDLITMGRISVDLYPEQIGVVARGGADVRQVARRERDERRRGGRAARAARR